MKATNAIFTPDPIYETGPYRRSRAAYIAQCTLEYFVSILCTDVYLAKLLKFIGCSDAFTGVLSSVASIAFLFQLLTVPMAARLKRVKKPVTALDTASQLLFTALYAVPFLPVSPGAQAAVAAALLLLGYFTFYINQSVAYRWGNAFVSPEHRARFSAGKEMISLSTGVGFTLAAGFATDAFEKRGALPSAFIFLGCVLAAVAAANFICFVKMEDYTLRGGDAAPQRLSDVTAHTFGNPRFRKVTFMVALREFAGCMVNGFMGTYKTQELGLSVSTVQMINVAASMGRFAVSRPFGSYSDRTSYAKGHLLGSLLSAGSFLCGAFTSPGTKWLIVPTGMLSAMSLAGTNQNTFHMIYAFTDGNYIMSALAICNSVRGACGFFGSLLGGRILSAVQRAGSTVLGRTLYGQQLLQALALALQIGVLIYNKAVVCRLTEERK